MIYGARNNTGCNGTWLSGGGQVSDDVKTVFCEAYRVCILDENCQVQPVNAGFTAPFWNLISTSAILYSGRVKSTLGCGGHWAS